MTGHPYLAGAIIGFLSGMIGAAIGGKGNATLGDILFGGVAYALEGAGTVWLALKMSQ